jgi:hypothetical protein
LEGPAIGADGFLVSASSGSWPAVLNKTASLNNSVYDLYSFTLLDPLARTEYRLNVGATFGGRNVSDWTSFSPEDDLPPC